MYCCAAAMNTPGWMLLLYTKVLMGLGGQQGAQKPLWGWQQWRLAAFGATGTRTQQEMEGYNPSPLFSTCEGTSGVLSPVLGSLVPDRNLCTRVSRENCYQDIWRAGTQAVLEKAKGFYLSFEGHCCCLQLPNTCRKMELQMHKFQMKISG